MKGTWGKRVFGAVSKTPRNTRFRLEVTLDNGCTIYETIVIPNDELRRYTRLYGHTLNRLTDKLEARIKERHQSWMAE
jgi:phosphoglycerate-specific signal transduction histidine kinase